MSEFTVGNLIASSHLEKVERWLEQREYDYDTQMIGERWIAFGFSDVQWMEKMLSSRLIELSHEVPVMYFYNAEDHGWGYQLFHQGQVTASLEVDYELAHTMAMDLFRQRYPGTRHLSPAEQACFQAFYDEFAETEEYQTVLRKYYDSANPSAFAAFGCGSEEIAELQMILSPAYTRQNDIFEQVDAFKAALKLEELEWISWD